MKTHSSALARSDLKWPQANCCMAASGRSGHCVCPVEERALRAWQDGQVMPLMTPEQREFCLAEIDRVEGCSRSDYWAVTDAELARGVLNAWTDYCRDKGLL